MKLYKIAFLLLLANQSFSQNKNNKIVYSAFGDLYYSFDFSKPQNHDKQNFIYNHKRHNELNANLLLIKAAYTENNTRANIGLMAGNYAQYNMSAEPNWAQLIYEANVGVKISKKENLWLDAGIMPSHIGFESAISADCWTLTRSILAENSPYFETGLKLSYINKNEKLTLAFLVLNGWQRIKKPDFIQKPSIGIQVNYKPSSNLTLNYSNFIGTDKADSLKANRLFHNLFLQYEPKGNFALITGFDIGSEKLNPNYTSFWFSPIVILRFTLNNKSKLSFRGEYYNDKNQIIVSTNTANGFKVSGISSNFDYKINDKTLFRIEGKLFNSKDKIFNNKNNNFSITTNLSIKI